MAEGPQRQDRDTDVEEGPFAGVQDTGLPGIIEECGKENTSMTEEVFSRYLRMKQQLESVVESRKGQAMTEEEMQRYLRLKQLVAIGIKQDSNRTTTPPDDIGNQETISALRNDDPEAEKTDICSGASPTEEDLDDDLSGKSAEARKGFQLKKSAMDQIHMEELRKKVADLGLVEWEWNDEKVVVKKIIGKGTYGNVTVISHPQNPGKDIIVKTLDDSCVREFVKELKLISSLKHKNIVDLYAYSIIPAHLCLLQEYMAFDWREFGEQHQSHDLYDFVNTLHTARQVKEFNGLSSWIWHIAIDVAKGVAFIHDHGVAHRDLKLQNILVANHPALGQRLIICKLGDFGEARAYSVQTKSNAKTATLRTQRGTWAYMAPEIVLEEIEMADHLALERMDVWSYGICILFILNPDLRNDPFYVNRGKSEKKTFVSDKQFMSQLMDEKEIPQPSEEYSFLREQYGYIERIRLMCLDYDPTERPNFTEIEQMLNTERKKEKAQNDNRPVQIAANVSKQDIPDRVQNDTSAEQVATIFQQSDQTLVKQETETAPFQAKEMTPLQTFKMGVLMSGRVISSSLDPEEVIAILYRKQILPLKHKQQMDTFPEDSIEKSEAILRFLGNLSESYFAYTEKVLSVAKTGQKYLVDLWQTGKTPLSAPPHWNLLRKNNEELLEIIEPTDLRQLLFAQNILTTRDYESIGKCSSRMDKVEKLLWIMRRKSFPVFIRFIEGLEATKQQHVADIITKDCDYPKGP